MAPYIGIAHSHIQLSAPTTAAATTAEVAPLPRRRVDGQSIRKSLETLLTQLAGDAESAALQYGPRMWGAHPQEGASLGLGAVTAGPQVWSASAAELLASRQTAGGGGLSLGEAMRLVEVTCTRKQVRVGGG